MGGVAALGGRLVYLDTNIFIYSVEGSAEHELALRALLRMLAAGETHACTSELTLAEVLVRPLADGRSDLANVYETMIRPSGWLTVTPVTRAILRQAARLRVELGLKLPDAIHVASALASRSDSFLTTDRRLRLPGGLGLHTLD